MKSVKLSKMNFPKPTICNVCGGKVILLTVGKQYSRSGFLYKCTQCGASVGTHIKHPEIPLGTLADREMKAKRRELHVWFDKLWTKHSEREKLYKQLATQLGIEREKCHFAQLDMDLLEKALIIVKQWWLERFDK